MTKVYVVTSRTFEKVKFEQTEMIFSIHGVFDHKAYAAEFVEKSYRDVENNKTFHIAELELNVPIVDEEKSRIMMMQNTIYALRYARKGSEVK